MVVGEVMAVYWRDETAARRRRGAAPHGAEDGGGRAPRGRRRARLQQPAHGDQGLRLAAADDDPAHRRIARVRGRDRRRPPDRAAALTAQLLAFSRRQLAAAEARSTSTRACATSSEMLGAARQRGWRAASSSSIRRSASCTPTRGRSSRSSSTSPSTRATRSPTGAVARITDRDEQRHAARRVHRLARRARTRRLRAARRLRQRRRDGRGDAGAHLRAVLHHEGVRATAPGSVSRPCTASPSRAAATSGSRARLARARRSPSTSRAPPRRSRRSRPTSPSLARAATWCCSSRTRTACAVSRAGAGDARLSRHRGHRWRAGGGAGARPTRRSACSLTDVMMPGLVRPRARRRGARDRARPAGALHVGTCRGRGARRTGRSDGALPRQALHADRLAEKVREVLDAHATLAQLAATALRRVRRHGRMSRPVARARSPSEWTSAASRWRSSGSVRSASTERWSAGRSGASGTVAAR